MQWRNSFNQYDRDRSGQIEFNELKLMLKQLGYTLKDPFVSLLFRVYDKDRSGRLGFDEFIQLCTELTMLTTQFASKDTSRQGRVTIDYETFLSMVFKVHA